MTIKQLLDKLPSYITVTHSFILFNKKIKHYLQMGKTEEGYGVWYADADMFPMFEHKTLHGALKLMNEFFEKNS